QQSVSVLSPTLAREVSGSAAQIRVEDLLAMRSGLDCGFRPGETELRAMRGSVDWIAYALGLPIVAEHGTRYGYCSPNSHLLSAVITAATGSSALDYARVHLFEPLGISDVYWPADSKGVTHGWGDLQLQPRDMAKLGLLMLERGRWVERQLLSSQWIERSTAARS